MPEIPWTTKLTLLLVSSLTIMSIITISPALPQMSAHFEDVKNGEFLVKLVLTIPALFIAIVAPIAGRLIDRFGRLKLLWMAIVLYAASGVAGYFLEDLIAILISRAILGISVGISMTVVITLVADYFVGVARQKFAGLQVAFMSIGGILFIGLGGILSDIGWRFPFLIYLFSLLILPFSIFYLTEPKIAKGGQSRSKIKSKVPSLIWILFINTMLMWIIFFLIPVQIPFFLEELGVSRNALVGAALAVSTLFSAMSSFSYARLKGRFSFSQIFTIGYILMALGFLTIAFAGSYGMVVLAMALSGLGIGVMIPNTNIWVMQLAPVEVRGREIGKLTTFWFMGQFLSPIVTFPVVVSMSIASTYTVAAIVLTGLALFFLILHLSGRSNPS